MPSLFYAALCCPEALKFNVVISRLMQTCMIWMRLKITISDGSRDAYMATLVLVCGSLQLEVSDTDLVGLAISDWRYWYDTG